MSHFRSLAQDLVPPRLRWVESAAKRTEAWATGSWLLILAALGWTALVVLDLGSRAISAGSTHVMLGMTESGTGVSAGWRGGVGAAAMTSLMWIAMILVMAPLILPNVRFVALRSPTRVRLRASVRVALGWAAVWGTAAITLGTLSALSQRVLPRPAVLGTVLLTAVCWQLSPRRTRHVVRCHRTFAPPLVGRAAGRACLRFGGTLGVDCVGSCWALMWLMDAAGHSVLLMVPLFWVSWYERFRRPHHDLRARATAGVVAAVGLGFLSATAWPHLG